MCHCSLNRNCWQVTVNKCSLISSNFQYFFFGYIFPALILLIYLEGKSNDLIMMRWIMRPSYKLCESHLLRNKYRYCPIATVPKSSLLTTLPAGEGGFLCTCSIRSIVMLTNERGGTTGKETMLCYQAHLYRVSSNSRAFNILLK